MNKLKDEMFGENRAMFGRALHFCHRGTAYLLIAPNDIALEQAWFDLHPSSATMRLKDVKDVGVMSEEVIRALNGPAEQK
jgi:hypothetical protein